MGLSGHRGMGQHASLSYSVLRWDSDTALPRLAPE